MTSKTHLRISIAEIHERHPDLARHLRSRFPRGVPFTAAAINRIFHDPNREAGWDDCDLLRAIAFRHLDDDALRRFVVRVAQEYFYLYSWHGCDLESEAPVVQEIQGVLNAPHSRDLPGQVRRTRMLIEMVRDVGCDVEEAVPLLNILESGEISPYVASSAAWDVGQYEAANMSPTAYDFNAQWVHQDQWLWLGRELATRANAVRGGT